MIVFFHRLAATIRKHHLMAKPFMNIPRSTHQPQNNRLFDMASLNDMDFVS
jgi:hypothetical protein